MPARHVRAPEFQTRLSPFAGFLTSLNVPLPDITSWVVTLLEVGGGILLILGPGTRLVPCCWR